MPQIKSFLTVTKSRIVIYAAFLLAALTFSAFANPPEFTLIRIAPSMFSPNSDGVQDSTTIFYTLTDTADTVSIGVRNTQERIVKTLVNRAAQPAGEHFVRWDGKDREGALVSEGKYTVIFDAQNGDGHARQAAIKVTVDTTAPSLSIEDIIPNPYTPNISSSDSAVCISFRVSRSDSTDNISVVILDTDAITPLDILHPEAFIGDGHYKIFWDGSSEQDGLYPFRIEAADRAGNNSNQITSFCIDLDLLAPKIHFTSPEHADYINFRPEAVAGTVFDRNGVKDIEVSFDGGQTFTALGISGMDTLSWNAELPDSLSEGEIIIQVRATDTPGHIFVLSDTLNIDLTAPETPLFDKLPERVTNPELTISGKTSPGDSVFIFIVDSTDATLTDTATVAHSDSLFSVSIKELTLGKNFIYAFARDMAGNKSDSSYVVVSFYEYKGPIEILIFSPEKFGENDVFKVELSQEGTEVEIHIYSLMGDLVRTLLSSERTCNYDIPWDMRNDGGELLKNGVYLCSFAVRLSNGTTFNERKLAAIVR